MPPALTRRRKNTRVKHMIGRVDLTNDRKKLFFKFNEDLAFNSCSELTAVTENISKRL